LAGDNSYVSLSGTSMAAPHVTGAVAIALSAKDFEYDKAFEISTKTAVQSGLGTVSPTSCGGVRFDSFPNYDYGYGRIDVCKMVNALGAAC
jgi:subtilisin family serine protease